MLSVTTANLHVLTPMWITTRLTSVPGDVGQPVVDVVDGYARDVDVLALTPREHQVRLDGTSPRVADQDVGHAWGNPELCQTLTR